MHDEHLIDTVFSALSDPIRRDIVERTANGELTVNQIAIEYDISLAAISKHLKVLLAAGLITKRRDGRFQYVSANKVGVERALEYLAHYSEGWSDRFNGD